MAISNVGIDGRLAEAGATVANPRPTYAEPWTGQLWAREFPGGRPRPFSHVPIAISKCGGAADAAPTQASSLITIIDDKGRFGAVRAYSLTITTRDAQ
jgi:hypothetical protein